MRNLAVVVVAMNPVVTRATGGNGEPIGGLRYDTTQYGYQEEEYYFDGAAKAYPSASSAWS